VNVLEVSNAETGAFRVRLLRKGERYGSHHQLIWDDDEPAVEFYGPAAEGERPADATFLGRSHARQFRRPSSGWSSVGWAGYCGVSPANAQEIAAWLERELELPWTPPPPPPRPPSQARAHRPIELENVGDRRVTLYVGGMFGYRRIEAERARVERRPYAQYLDAVVVRYLPRRAKLSRIIRLTSGPDLVILLGWGHPDLQQATEVGESTLQLGQLSTTYTVTSTKYASTDPRYDEEFESALDAYLAGLPLTQLLLDLRGETITQRRGATRGPEATTVPVFDPSGVRGRDGQTETGEQAGSAVFVSYHHGRDADARARFERENGAVVRSVSIYPGEISRDREVRQEIRRRIVSCDFLVVLVGRETYTRHWVDREIHAALTADGEGSPRPVVGVLLPEMASLGAQVTPQLDVDPDEPVTTILQRSRALSEELMAATGATLPARLLDNLLSGYAALIAWPTSPAALLDALASAGGRSRPVNNRRLLSRNLPSPDGAPEPPNAAIGPAEARPPAPPDTGPLHRRTETGAVPRHEPAAAPQVTEPDVEIDSPASLAHALQKHGPDSVMGKLTSDRNPRRRRWAHAVRRHAHLLAPLDSAVSLAATLVARLDDDETIGGLRAGLTTMLQAPWLAAVAVMPDLPPAGLVRALRAASPSPGPENGIGSGIEALAADPAGRWLASLTRSGTLRVWNLPAGSLRHTWARPAAGAGGSRRVLVADPGGAWLAAGGPEGFVDVRDPIGGAELHTFPVAAGGISALAAQPQGAWLAALDSLGVLHVWSMPSGTPLLEKYTGAGVMVADPAGRWLAIGSGSTVRVWDVTTAERLHDFTAPGYVSALAVSPRGDWLCCAADRPTVRVWPMPDGEPKRDITNRARVPDKRVRCLATDPAGSWLATGGHDGAVRIWSAASGGKGPVLAGHRGGFFDGVRALAVAPDGGWLASAGSDRTVRTWDVRTGAPRHCFTGHTREIGELIVGRSGRWLASGSDDGTVRIWDPDERSTPRHPVDAPLGSVTALAADPSGSWHAYAQGNDGGITIRDGDGRRARRTSASHESHRDDAVTALQADPRGAWLASAGRDGAIRIWDPHDGSERYLLTGRSHPENKEITTRLAAAPDGRWLACYGTGPKIWIWSPATGERLNTLWAAGGAVNGVAIDPSGTWLASAAADGAVRLWRPDGARPHRVLAGHEGAVHGVAIHPAGTHLVSYGEDATIRVRTMADDSTLTLDALEPARILAMSPRGDWFASAGGDATIRIWDLGAGSGHRTLAGHDVPPAALTADPTGRYLASVGRDATVRVWEPATGTAVASMRVDGALTGVLWTAGRLVLGGAQGAYVLELRNG